jgi:hypothetical protein
MSQEFEDQLADLREARYRTLGTRTPCCSIEGCGERDPFALTGADPNILIWPIAMGAAGSRSTIRAGGPTTRPLSRCRRTNHPVVTGYQSLWDRDTLRNPDGSPLLRGAAAIRAWLDILRLIIERTVGWVPVFLERLDDYLRHALGPDWWQQWGSES